MQTEAGTQHCGHGLRSTPGSRAGEGSGHLCLEPTRVTASHRAVEVVTCTEHVHGCQLQRLTHCPVLPRARTGQGGPGALYTGGGGILGTTDAATALGTESSPAPSSPACCPALPPAPRGRSSLLHRTLPLGASAHSQAPSHGPH